MKIIPTRTMSLRDAAGEMKRYEANGKPQEASKESGEYAIRMGWAKEAASGKAKEAAGDQAD